MATKNKKSILITMQYRKLSIMMMMTMLQEKNSYLGIQNFTKLVFSENVSLLNYLLNTCSMHFSIH